MAYQSNEQPSAFPQELPPRDTAPTQRGGLRDCLSLRFLRSYSLRGVTDKRTRWRRGAMIATLVILLSTAIANFVISLVTGGLPVSIALSIVDVVLAWATGWSLAVIGDAVGTRKVCGITIGRTFFDVFIYVVLVFYTLFFIITWLTVGLFIASAAWLGVAILIFIVAYIASEPPSYP